MAGWPAVAAVLVAIMWMGCAAFQLPEEPPEPNPIQPVWSDDELEDHLAFLNSGEAAKRSTGTQGYVQAAAYVASRMREFKLQPVLEGEFRVVYGTPINYPLSVSFRAVSGADSVRFLPGIDMLPDGRTDSGDVATRTIVMTDDTSGVGAAPDEPFAVVFREDGVDTATLTRWRAAGAVLAISIQPLVPRFYSTRVSGLVVLQLAPPALRRMLTIEAATRPYGSVIRLEHPLAARVQTDFEPSAGALNVMGYISGKHPEHARDLVLICSDLDGVSDFSGVPTIDFRNLAVGTAALLEVARNLSYVSDRWSLPERSVMAAVWSGSQLGHAGLRYFLDDPTWSLRRIVSVIYIGLEPEEEPVVRQLLAERGVRLYVIPPPSDPGYERSVLLLPDPVMRRLARDRRRAEQGTAEESAFEPIVPDLDAVIDSSVVRAKVMADAAYARLMMASTHPDPFSPVYHDTLLVPQAAGDESP